MHHLENSKIDFALIYKEKKIDSALPKLGKKETVALGTLIKKLKTH